MFNPSHAPPPTHCAGEEKETRDGHYLYHTEGVFTVANPLEAGNMAQVQRWLSTMVIHQGSFTHPAGGAGGPGWERVCGWVWV